MSCWVGPGWEARLSLTPGSSHGPWAPTPQLRLLVGTTRGAEQQGLIGFDHRVSEYNSLHKMLCKRRALWPSCRGAHLARPGLCPWLVPGLPSRLLLSQPPLLHKTSFPLDRLGPVPGGATVMKTPSQGPTNLRRTGKSSGDS